MSSKTFINFEDAASVMSVVTVMYQIDLGISGGKSIRMRAIMQQFLFQEAKSLHQSVDSLEHKSAHIPLPHHLLHSCLVIPTPCAPAVANITAEVECNDFCPQQILNQLQRR